MANCIQFLQEMCSIKQCIECFIYLFIKINSFIYLFLAALGLCCCTQAFSSCGERRLFFVAVRGLLIVVASLVASTGSRRVGFSSCETRAQ